METASHTATYPISSVAMSADGRRLLAGDVERKLLCYEDGKPSYRLDLRSRFEKIRATERMRTLAFSPDGRLFYASASETMRAFEAESGRAVWGYTPPRHFGFLIVSPLQLSVSTEGLVAACFDDGTIGCWTEEGDCISRWADNDAPRMLRFVPDTRHLVGTDAFSICVWDPEERRKLDKFVLPEKAFGFDAGEGGLVAVRSLDFVAIYSLKGGLMHAFPVGEGLPLVAVRPGGRGLALGGLRHVDLCDLDGRVVDDVDVAPARVTALAWSPDGGQLCVGCSDGTVLLVPFGFAA
jgi:WD40 repeat protein